MEELFCANYHSKIGDIIITWKIKGITSINRKINSSDKCSNRLPEEYKKMLDTFFSFTRHFRNMKLNLSEKKILINNIPLIFQNTPESHIKIYYNLLKIHPGKTISYGDLAQKAGYPGAARLCGTAMAQNPFSFIIPCHRVILSSGKSGNYGGGKELKIKLLKKEGAL